MSLVSLPIYKQIFDGESKLFRTRSIQFQLKPLLLTSPYQWSLLSITMSMNIFNTLCNGPELYYYLPNLHFFYEITWHLEEDTVNIHLPKCKFCLPWLMVIMSTLALLFQIDHENRYCLFNSLRLSHAFMRQYIKHHCLRSWLVAKSAPSHYLNQCWNIVNWTLGNKL